MAGGQEPPTDFESFAHVRLCFASASAFPGPVNWKRPVAESARTGSGEWHPPASFIVRPKQTWSLYPASCGSTNLIVNRRAIEKIQSILSVRWKGVKPVIYTTTPEARSVAPCAAYDGPDRFRN